MKKNNIKFTNILILFLLGFLLASVNSSTLISTANASTNNPIDMPNLQALVDHVPIYIEFDENFTDYGFPGSGSLGDPFRIENYNITVSGDYPILFDGNNTKYFVIQNCFLKTDTNIGIYLGKYYDMGEYTVNVLNNVIISDTSTGIQMEGGKGSVISGNTISSKDSGILMVYGNFSMVSENIITGLSSTEAGILLYDCYNLTITKNTCLGYSYGILLDPSSDSIITHNNCSENYIGIQIYGHSYNNSITNNICIENTLGIKVQDGDDSVFTNNLLQENDEYGIDISSNSDNNILHHNAFIDNNLLGVSQAVDDGSNNIWYDDVALEGNYWSDWVSGSYSIEGSASAFDIYPLNYIPEISEYSSIYLAILMILALLVIPVINFGNEKKKK